MADDVWRVRAAVARSDGRASFRPYGKDWRDHVGETVEVAGRKLRVSKDGRVHIPKSLMQEMGTRNPDGRRVIGIQTGARYDGKGKKARLSLGARVVKLDEEQAKYTTGELIPKEGFKRADLHVLKASDSKDYYYD